MKVRKPDLNEIPKISYLLSANKDDFSLFQQSEKEIKINIRDFLIAEIDGVSAGCIALHKYKNNMAEILALSVLESYQKNGIGSELIAECVRTAAEKKINLLWLATAKPSYFLQFGFLPMSKWSLPRFMLRRKLRLIFQQPIKRWLPALFGRHTFMRYNAGRRIADDKIL